MSLVFTLWLRIVGMNIDGVFCTRHSGVCSSELQRLNLFNIYMFVPRSGAGYSNESFANMFG